MKSLAVSLPMIVFLHGTKCTFFENWSIITQIVSNSDESDKSVMKSIEIDDHGCFGFGSGCSNP